ncbi:MAG: SdiA-regulated domain-containing protein [Chitinophagales bacterium]
MVKIKKERVCNIRVAEPSDICYSPATHTYFTVSDNGWLYEINESGQTLRKSPFHGMDFEAVWADSTQLYVSEELSRLILTFDLKSLEKTGSYKIHESGARNKGIESITWNAAKQRFLVAFEGGPVRLLELDRNFQRVNDFELKVASDISAATYFKNSLFLLSDEDRKIFQLNPITYQLERIWEINVLNPEGLCFTPEGNLLVVSDDLQQLYVYPKILQ